jgi:hypothetical protein
VRALKVRLEVARTNAAKALAALACNCEAVAQEICNVDKAKFLKRSPCGDGI